MVRRVLIIGGYGNFGSYIAKSLANDTSIRLLIGGRSAAKAETFIQKLTARHAPEPAVIDISGDMPKQLAALRPDIVVHTTGPFQNQTYAVAEGCLKQGCHYIDLADARAFVTGITRYDGEATKKNLLIVSGASSVPCLTAAVIDHYRPQFRALEKVEYGISAAQQTNRGLATTSAVLSYVGKPFRTRVDGHWKTVHGWQDLHAETYPELGRRWFSNCDIPDLDLFPARYPELKTVRFSAGHEVPALHLGLWLLSWGVRMKCLPSLERLAPFLLKASFLFQSFGTSRSGFHMFLTGMGQDGVLRTEKFYIIARSAHGPFIPCMPAILLAKGLAGDSLAIRGARPCLDLIDLDTYLGALKGLDISIVRSKTDEKVAGTI